MRERPVVLGVSGIGHFGNNVVFAKVVQDSNLDLLNKVASKYPIKIYTRNLCLEKTFSKINFCAVILFQG